MCGKLSNSTPSTFLTACSDDYSLRSAAADVWSLCATKLFGDLWVEPSNNHGGPIAFDTRAGNFDQVNYVEATTGGTCTKLPGSDFLPILSQACSSSFMALQDSTSGTFRSSSDTSKEEQVLYCQVEAAIHYTRCTQWPSNGANNTTATSILACVQDATSRLPWVDFALLTDNGKSKCSDPSDMIRRLAIYNLVFFIYFLLFASRRLIVAVFGKCRRRTQNNDDDKLVETNYWTWFLSLAFHIGCTIGTAMLTLGNGRNTAALPPNDSMRLDVGIWQTMEIWALRPRIAGILALIGLVNRGYTGRALRAMFVNMLMCFLGVVWSGNLAFGSPPAQGTPPEGWEAMRKGGLATVIAQLLFVLIGGLLGCGGKTIQGCLRRAKELNEQRHPDQSRTCGVSRREFGKLDWAMYWLLMVLSLWLYASSWAMWVGFLKVYGPLYCPPEMRKVDLMWLLGGLGTELLSLVWDVVAIGRLPSAGVSRGLPEMKLPLSSPTQDLGPQPAPIQELPYLPPPQHQHNSSGQYPPQEYSPYQGYPPPGPVQYPGQYYPYAPGNGAAYRY
ncbi:hypothetical protein V8F20_002687 [Naviculisporaceae sp. PSN 640]